MCKGAGVFGVSEEQRGGHAAEGNSQGGGIGGSRVGNQSGPGARDEVGDTASRA